MLNHVINLDRIFHALADPTRRAMIERLGRAPASVSELANPMSVSLAAIVQHVQILEASGLVRTEKVGRVRTCRLDAGTLMQAERWLEARRGEWNARLDRLGEYLEETTHPPTPTPKKGQK
ncbi:MAG TPA: metalloregulator ArsR/SmtB family transcription factor [Steroidobacteraceae bacterium]|nr:metalloregulator ArsR/SmtB family transcription factor [Steroidobacteraceae bacterium]